MSPSPIAIGVGNDARQGALLPASAQRQPPPAQRQPPGPGQAEFVICDQTIEQLFRTLKRQGLDVEASQLGDASRLLKLTAVAARAAAVTLQLVQARDGAGGEPATVALDEDEAAALDALGPRLEGGTARQRNPHPPRSLAWAAWIVARLGGWDGYPSARRPPGPITLKRGLDRLRAIAEGWTLRDLCMP